MTVFFARDHKLSFHPHQGPLQAAAAAAGRKGTAAALSLFFLLAFDILQMKNRQHTEAQKASEETSKESYTKSHRGAYRGEERLQQTSGRRGGNLKHRKLQKRLRGMQVRNSKKQQSMPSHIDNSEDRRHDCATGT